MNRTAALRRFFSPETVAVFGGNSAAEVIRQCRKIGFAGEIFAVNPKRSEIEGIACVASVADLPCVPDASFVAAPPAAALAIIRELAARGAPGAVCFAAGFAETGDAQGKAMQQQLREAAGDMAVLGPNCHGFINYLDKVALWPDEHGGRPVDNGAALISQSGNIAINLTMQERHADFSYVITVGNSTVLGLHDYIDALLDDERVRVIALHIEGIADIAAFSAAAVRALKKGVPIVALKAGRSARGAEITMSHTASLAGSDVLYTALFERVGVARCDTVSQFLETIKFLAIVGPLDAASVGSMSCSGGEASLVADCADHLQLELPSFSASSAKRLRALLGPNVSVSNPLDYHLYIWGDYEQLHRCFAEVLSNGFACNLLVLDYPPKGETANWETSERALIQAVADTGGRAVIVSSLPETLPAEVRERLQQAGIAPMQGIEDCLFAVRAAAAVGKAQRNAANTTGILPVAAVTGTPHALDEAASKKILAAAGLRIPTGETCTADEALAAANRIGYPVVVKAVSSELAHKSEAGAVIIDLRDEAALSAAVERLRDKSERLLVESMAQSVVAELIVGISRDPGFGLTLTIGAGGVLVELVEDSVSLLLPVRRDEIETALRKLRVRKLLDGFRGKPAGDIESVIDAIEAVAAFAIEHNDTLLELDVNPLCVTPDGAVAVDAFIRTAS